MNAVILFVALAIDQPQAPATFYCPAPVANKGEMKAGSPLVHTFTLVHNAPAATVTITRVEAGCGCLRQSLTQTTLQRGETAALTIEVNTLTQPDGPNRWQILVGYRVESPGAEPQMGELVLRITATLTRDFVVSPPQIAFSATGAASQIVTITDKRAKPVTICKGTSSAAYLTVEVAQPGAAGPGGRTQAVTIKLAANAPVGHRDEMVVLLTDDPACPELRIPVRVLKRAADGVTANPDTVYIRLAPGQTEESALIQLRRVEGKPLSVAHAASDHPAVQVKWSTGSGPVATVRVTVTGATATETGRCTVRVRLSEPPSELTIPVSWTRGGK